MHLDNGCGDTAVATGFDTEEWNDQLGLGRAHN
jgi:hypothetical protein